MELFCQGKQSNELKNVGGEELDSWLEKELELRQDRLVDGVFPLDLEEVGELEESGEEDWSIGVDLGGTKGGEGQEPLELVHH